MPRVLEPDPATLLERLRALPATQPLLRAPVDASGAYVVGGAVRDLLLGGSPSELDLVVEGDALAFARSLAGTIRPYDRFGTSSVTVEGFRYDIAQARRETYAHPGALPNVTPASLTEDLRRRDFTVNAIAIALMRGELHSVPGALDDLSARRLRVLHDASFIDDPTRMLRLARYASRLTFAVEPRTQTLLEAARAGGALRTVSGARIGTELRLLAAEDDPIAAMLALRELGLDDAIDPDMGLTEEALARRALELLPSGARHDRVALAMVARRVPPGRLAALLDQLAFPACDRDAIVATVGRAEPLARALSEATAPSGIAQAAAGAPDELVALAGALGPAEQARRWFTELRHVQLEIGGEDLLAAGAPPGPPIGRGLRAALAAKLDGRTRGREGELEVALEAARETG